MQPALGDLSRRDTAHYGKGLDVTSDHSSRHDHRTATDGDSLQDDGPYPNPHIVIDDNRPVVTGEGGVIDIMSPGNERYFRRDAHVIPDDQTTGGVDQAFLVDDRTVADGDTLSAGPNTCHLNVLPHKDGGIVADVPAEYPAIPEVAQGVTGDIGDHVIGHVFDGRGSDTTGLVTYLSYAREDSAPQISYPVHYGPCQTLEPL
jgi:hypothetical protein